MANSSNPFDFSDFQARGGSTNDDMAGDRGFESASPGDFDPFAESDLSPTSFRESSAGAASFDRFGGSAAFATTDTVESPPVVWCGAACVAAVAGVVLAVLGFSTVSFALAGWFFAGPLAIGLLAVHTMMDTRKRANVFYSQPGWAVPLYWAVMTAAFIGVAASSWPIADWVGRQ